MNAKDVILRVYATAERVIDAYLNDLSDEDLLVRPVAGQNHVAWQLGHLISTEYTLLNQMKPGASPELPAGFLEAHGRDETSFTSDDPSRFLPKSKYVELMATQREATRAVLAALPEAELDAVGPERVRKNAPTVGATFLLIGSHYILHSGQFVSVRRALKKPIAF